MSILSDHTERDDVPYTQSAKVVGNSPGSTWTVLNLDDLTRLQSCLYRDLSDRGIDHQVAVKEEVTEYEDR